MTANKPLLVGAFVLGAFLLAVIAILLFGGMHLFTRTSLIVGVFQGSVAGLNVGSPVTFRGVNIGKVARMQVQMNVVHHTGIIPVYMEIEPDKIAWVGGNFHADAKSFREAVSAGIRAQLRSDSLVTGQLSVDLDFHPGTPALLTHLSGEEPEIPTMPSDLQNVMEQIQSLKLRELTETTRLALSSMQHFLDDADGQIGPLTMSVRSTLDTARVTLSDVRSHSVRTLDQIDKLAVEGRGQIATDGRDLDQLVRTAQATATEAQTLVTSLNNLTAERSPLRDDLESSVRDLADSAGSLRTLTRELERDPMGTLLKKSPR
jgi:paraquat-inducible protein B